MAHIEAAGPTLRCVRGVPTSTKSILPRMSGKIAARRSMSSCDTRSFWRWYSSAERVDLEGHSMVERGRHRTTSAPGLCKGGGQTGLDKTSTDISHQLSIQSDVKAWTRCFPGGATEGSSVDGMDRKTVPRESYILDQSSRRMWWQCVPSGSASASTPMCTVRKDGACGQGGVVKG